MLYTIGAILISTVALLGIVLLIINGLCSNGGCCQKGANKNCEAGNVRNNVAAHNEAGDPAHDVPCEVPAPRCGSNDSEKHIYADVIKSGDYEKKVEEPCRGYVPMEVLKIRPNEESLYDLTDRNGAKNHLYVNDITPPHPVLQSDASMPINEL